MIPATLPVERHETRQDMIRGEGPPHPTSLPVNDGLRIAFARATCEATRLRTYMIVTRPACGRRTGPAVQRSDLARRLLWFDAPRKLCKSQGLKYVVTRLFFRPRTSLE